nr:immunoglobulin heavy chain junction region [Macaca mulatta]MOV49242.1 immunoglobulin heavy chain junction region [Macaca mulatta]MOV49386.1 immunoglobulin heavy chain junction region [Macaca mulatta]MOV49773.1 immunoglobulin heavy chain junction region [Macaca mulatta]MOV50140.1 immunoglobulin heavy chain junction region [Macaca mulatta]
CARWATADFDFW